MGNNTTDTKLDETIKDTLSKYDATAEVSDWSRMENMLNMAPQASKFTMSHKIFAGVGVIVIAGAFFMYTHFHSTAIPVVTKIETPVEQVNNSVQPAAAPLNAAVKNENLPVISPTPIETPTILPVIPMVKNDVIAVEKTKTDKSKKVENASNTTKTLQVSVMGNEPVFGDMIDSSKGIIRETKEKERIKKAAKAKGSNNIGLSGLLHINVDSLRKQQNQQIKKDSL
jgi:hypothetical protein